MDIKVIFNNAFNAIKKHAGTIYAGAAVVGVGATVYLSGKAAVEVDHKIEPGMDIREKAKIYAKAYWLAILVSGATIGSIVMSDRTHVHGKALLAGALAMANERYHTFEDKTREIIGDDAANDIHREIVKDKFKDEDVDYFNLDEGIGDKPLYFYEPVSGQCINTTYLKLVESLLETNFRLQNDFSVELNVFNEHIGGEALPRMLGTGWDFENEAQQSQAEGSGKGFVIDFTPDVWDEIKYFVRPDIEMHQEDRININYAVWPDEMLPFR